MRLGKITLLAPALAVGLTLLGGAPVARAQMSPEEIKELFPGTFMAIWKDKKRAVVEATTDGILHGKTSGGSTDTGRWWFKGEEFCVAFTWWTFNKAKCGTIDKKGAWYVGFYRKNGKPRVRFKRQ